MTPSAIPVSRVLEIKRGEADVTEREQPGRPSAPSLHIVGG
jgi:hypothetical protein